MPGASWALGKLQRRRTDGSRYWSWCIKWYDEGGHRRRVSLGTTDEQAAKTLAREFWARLTLTKVDTVGQVVEAYLCTLLTREAFDAMGPEDRANNAAKLKDARRKRVSWGAASAYWAGILTTQVDEVTSHDYVAWRKRKANTVRNELGLIRTALNWAVKREMIERAPPILLPAMPASQVSHLSKDQFRAFLAACHAPHVALFAQLAVTTGGRATALLELRWEQVDFERRLVNLNPSGRIQKANKQRATVPLNDRIVGVLHEAFDHRLSDYVIEWGGRRVLDIKKAMAGASARSGVRATPHMFRHSAAVWMAEARVPMSEIAAFLGHSDTRITERVYARFSPDYLRRAGSALDW